MSDLILRTQRLVMLPLSTGDLDEIAPIYGDDHAMSFIDGGVRNRDQARRALEANERCWKALGWGRWAVRDAKTGALLGECGTQHVLGVADIAMDFGFVFSARHRDSDFATEAGHAITEDLWGRITANHIHSILHPDDRDRVAVVRTIGFRRLDQREVHGEPVEVWELPRLR